MKPACKDCFWWVADEFEYITKENALNFPMTVVTFSKPLLGHCHLRPPISGSNPRPKTLAQDYCRAFKSKEDVD